MLSDVNIDVITGVQIVVVTDVMNDANIGMICIVDGAKLLLQK